MNLNHILNIPGVDYPSINWISKSKALNLLQISDLSKKKVSY